MVPNQESICSHFHLFTHLSAITKAGSTPPFHVDPSHKLNAAGHPLVHEA